jgi:peroxiredoxin
MSDLAIGESAPPFRLSSAAGSEISTEDYRGKKNLVVWFTKGMACPFCRAHMAQIARAYPEVQRLSAEVLEVTPTTPERARMFGQKFALPFPYLCDPDYGVRRAWTKEVRSHSPLWYAKSFVGMMRSEPPAESNAAFGKVTPTPSEMTRMLLDDDVGFFILDKESVVRFSMVGSYIKDGAPRPIPNNDVILRELSLCA